MATLEPGHIQITPDEPVTLNPHPYKDEVVVEFHATVRMELSEYERWELSGRKPFWRRDAQ